MTGLLSFLFHLFSFINKGLVKRKILVLDLDETLIHSQHDGVIRQMVKPGTPPDFVLKVTIDRHPVRFFVHKRPHVDYFLEVVSVFFSLFFLPLCAFQSWIHKQLQSAILFFPNTKCQHNNKNIACYYFNYDIITATQIGQKIFTHGVQLGIAKINSILFIDFIFCFFHIKVSHWYELVVFTASMEIYGAAVADKLDNSRNILNRRFFRQHCTLDYGSYTKDLSAITNDLSSIFILDNSPGAYRAYPGNE